MLKKGCMHPTSAVFGTEKPGNGTSFFPSRSELRKNYEDGLVVPLVFEKEWKGDPFEAYSLFQKKGKHSFFLDSVRKENRLGLNSYIGIDPFLVFKSKGKKIEITEGGSFNRKVGRPLDELRLIMERFKGKAFKRLPFFTGGAAGYFGYEVSRQIESLPNEAPDEQNIPDIYVVFVRNLLVFDMKVRKMRIVTNLLPDRDGTFEEAYENARRRTASINVKLEKGRVPGKKTGGIRIKDFKSNFTSAEFSVIVRKAKRYIKAGDIYQANLSQRFSFNFKGDAAELYRRLREINPSPFSSFLDFGGLKVVSSSPERLIKLEGRQCETRPIAGTRPRGTTEEETSRFSKELMLNEKERAEHIMLVDLERNDLGRVCDYGTVKVDELMTLEKYSHVIHIVSNVVGRLGKDKDRFDLLRAMFPGGTITGCPKIRCMEIIDELEPCQRGLYTGSIGYLDFNGNMDLNIVIRTIVLRKNKGYLQVGAGIVHDSKPEAEYKETLAKGEALVEALGAKE